MRFDRAGACSGWEDTVVDEEGPVQYACVGYHVPRRDVVTGDAERRQRYWLRHSDLESEVLTCLRVSGLCVNWYHCRGMFCVRLV